jgi:hypothetical protein
MIRKLLERGLQQDGDFERHLGTQLGQLAR